MVSTQALVKALHHAHQFLDLLDVANVLSTCHGLRNDRSFATHVLESNVHSQHFFQNCTLDWFEATPQLCIEDGHWQRCNVVDSSKSNEAHQNGHEHSDKLASSSVDLIDDKMMDESFTPQVHTSPYLRSINTAKSGHSSIPRNHQHRPWHPQSELTAAPFQRAQLINLVCLVERILLRWCYQPVVVADEVHVLRPIVLPLYEGGEPDSSSARNNMLYHQDCWKEGDVRARLNEARQGSNYKLEAGDPHRTCFGVHWDNIQIEGSHTYCACCEAFEPTLHEYRHTVSLLYRRWLTTAASCRAVWREQGLSPQQVAEMVDVMREELLPSHGFFNESMAAARDEELMEFICTHTNMSHSFDVCPDQPTDPKRYSWKSVFHPTMRSLCRQIIVPLKVAASQRLLHSTRASARWEFDDPNDSSNGEVASDDANTNTRTDFELPYWSDIVTGVYPGGFLVGFYYMTHRHDAPPPCKR